MNLKNEIIAPFKNIRGGAHVPHFKNTAESESVIMPPPQKVIIPMQQHIGAPCVPSVKKGDTVYVGTKIGDSDKFVSAPVHSSVSGTVSGIVPFLMPNGKTCDAVVIDSDGLMTPDPDIKPIEVNTAEELIKAIRESGLVGLGGAGFPTSVKLRFNPDNPPDTLIINGAECEPYITSDYRECMENPNHILDGVYLIKRLFGFKRVVICIENNKPKALELLARIAGDEQDCDDTIKVMKLKARYPQGAEKVLIYTATGRKLPLGKLPIDVGCVVMNIASISFISKYLKTGMPLVSKLVTVDGNAIAEAKNVRVPIGTSIQDVIDFCGGLKTAVRKILYGGPMMGTAVLDASMPVLKQNNAILVLDRKQSEKRAEQPCIRCARCAGACPMGLQPLEIEAAYRAGDMERVKELHVDYCMECGSCGYVCPSKRYLTQVMRMAKNDLRNMK